MKLHIHSQTSTVAPLEFGNGWVISSNILPSTWLLIHAWIKVNSMLGKEAPDFVLTDDVLIKLRSISHRYDFSIHFWFVHGTSRSGKTGMYYVWKYFIKHFINITTHSEYSKIKCIFLKQILRFVPDRTGIADTCRDENQLCILN